MPAQEEFLKKTPQQSRSRAVVGALVTALEQLLEKSEDASGISVGKVAERAGVGIGSLYDYFKTREGLFGEFISRLTDENFLKMKAAVDASQGEALGPAVHRIVEATFDTYLARPKRTRAAILTIFRLGWVDPVIRERDRFAAVLAQRVLQASPGLDPEKAERACRVLCDAVMGVVATQVWRPAAEARADVTALSVALLQVQLGLKLDDGGLPLQP